MCIFNLQQIMEAIKSTVVDLFENNLILLILKLRYFNGLFYVEYAGSNLNPRDNNYFKGHK